MEYSKSTDFNLSYDMLGNETNLASIYPMLDVYETVIASILTTFTISSCISNFIIVFVFMRYKCLRTKHDMLVINLAFTNLLITVGISFYSTYTLHPGDILHMKLVCLNLFILILGGILASLLVLLYLSLERYLCIVHPHFHKRIKVRHVVACNIFAYGLGIAFTAIPFLLKNNWDRHELCVADVFPFEFSIAEQVIGILIIAAIIVMNIIVYRTALTQASKINTLLKNVQNRHNTKSKFRQKGKAFVTVFLLSGISAICWIPLLVVFGLESDPDLHQDLRWIFTQLLYIPISLNSSVTAVIIGYRNRHFRDAIQSLYRKRKHECNRFNNSFL